MRKALVRKGYALALLAVFALVLGGCCQSFIDAAKASMEAAKAAADRAAASVVKAEAAAQDAKVPGPKAAAAASRAEAAAAKAEDFAEQCCAKAKHMRGAKGKVRHHKKARAKKAK